MKRWACLFVLVGCASFSRADLITGTYSSSSAAGAWPGSPAYVSLPNAGDAAAAAQSVPAPADTGGDPGVQYSALAEIFTLSSTFTLGGIAIVGSGGVPSNNTLNLRLYTLATHGGTGFPNGNNATSGDKFYFAGSEMLGTSSTGLFFNFPGFTGQKVMTFNLSNGPTSNDQVTLTAGTTYALEMWVPTAESNIFFWGRAGAAPFDTGGQMMGTTDASDFTHSRNSLAALSLAGGPRTGGLALYAATPEPGSLAVIGAAAWILAACRRAR